MEGPSPSSRRLHDCPQLRLKMESKDSEMPQTLENNNKSLLFRKVLRLCLVLCSISILSAFIPSVSGASSKGEKRVVCYFTNWSAYRQGPAKFLPDNINPYLCTHLVYAFGGLTSDSGIKPFDKYQDIDKGGYTKFNGLKSYNKALKTLIAIGGWNEGSRRFSTLVSDAESRKNFIKHAIRFLRQYQFDGLDLDWEYPASREGGVPEDKSNYAQFIKELREAFEDESKSTGRARLLLTVAVPAGIEWITKGFDIPVINRNIDFFNLLTYDYHASTEPNANHHAPLKARDGISEYDWKGQLNIEYTINHYLKEGADPDKLVVGLPTYGRSYHLFNVDSYDIDAPSSGPGTKGKYTKEPGYLAYYEICEGVKSGEWRVENADSDIQGPHAVKHDQWVGYDDTRMMAIKAKWVKDNGLGGIMFWSVDNDDFRGICHGKPFPLIEAAKLAYLTGDAPALSSNRQTTSKLNRPSLNKNNRFSTSLSNSRRITTTPAPPKTTTGAPTKSRRNKNRRNKNKKNKTSTTSTTTTTPAPPTTTSNPLSTPEPPTTPDPGVDFECKDDGFFPHPRECKKYFWCLDAPGLGLVAHHFTCPAGLFFNKNTDSCDYARNVACKDKNAASATTIKATTTTVATTTTTTKAPTTARTTTTTAAPEEEYDDDEEYDDEEEEPEEKPTKAASSKKKSTDDNNGRSVKEINDIKDLLKLIRKLGGVEELEKYLDENPGVAAVLDEYDNEEEAEEKPKSSTTSSLFNRNRFTPAASSSSTTNTRSRLNNPVASSSLKYTSIQRNRPSTTTTTSNPIESLESEEEEEEEPVPKKKFSYAKPTSRSSPKYVTLSRNSKQTDSDLKSTTTGTTSTSTQKTTTTTPKASSSTETSIVVRFSRDDEKILDEISSGKNGTSKEKISDDSTKTRTTENDDDDDTDGRYVQLSRTRSTTSSVSSTTQQTPKNTDTAEDDEASEEYDSEEDPDDKSIVEHSSSTTTTQTQKPSTTTTTAKAKIVTTSATPITTKRNVRIPTRKVNGFSSRTRGTTTTSPPDTITTTTSDASSSSGNDASSLKNKNFAVGNRRNLFQNRNRATSTAPSTVTDTSSSQTANEESIAQVDLLTGSEIFTRVDDNNEIATPRPKSRSRSISRSSYQQAVTTPSDSKNIRSRSRFRSTTEKIPSSVTNSLSTTPIVFRRRVKAKTTTTTTTTTSTTTPRPTSKITPKEDEEEAEYYYYYYDEDDEPTLPQVSSYSTKDLFQRSGSAVLSSPQSTQRTTGLRTETFTPSTSTVQLHQHQQLSFSGLDKGGDRGFAKRNLESQPPPPPPQKVVEKAKTTIRPKTRKINENNSEVNKNNQNSEYSSNHKWSDRATVPLSEKIKLRDDGSVECLDRGIFPHPISCSMFVHCSSSEMNDGSVKAWVYSCPKLLTFDPVGGMCNYDEFANKRAPGGNSCIE